MQEPIKYNKLYYYEGVLKHYKDVIKRLENTDKSLNKDTSITNWEWINPIDDIIVHKRHAHEFSQEKLILPSISSQTDPDLQFISTYPQMALQGCLSHYLRDTEWIDISLVHLSIAKGRMGKILGEHSDSQDSNIKISATLYLNNDYEGGEIVFPKQGIELKPFPGSIIIYPSNEEYSHYSKIITSGSKYTYNTFWA